MQAVDGQPLESLARWFRYVYGDAQCFDPSYATAVARYSNPEWDQVGTDNGSMCFRVINTQKNLKIVPIFLNFQDVNGISYNVLKLVHS